MPDLGRIPGPIVVPNAIEVDILWNLPWGKQVKNVLHGTVGAGFNVTAAVAQAIYAALLASGQWAAFLPFLHTTASIAGIALRDLRTANNPFAQSTGAAVAGTGAATALPPGSCLTITERSAFAGRGFRGRVYLPATDSSAMVAATGLYSAAAQTAFTNLIVALENAMTGQAITHALIQPARAAYTGRRNRAIPARAAATVQVTSVLSRLGNPSSQRRRNVAA